MPAPRVAKGLEQNAGRPPLVSDIRHSGSRRTQREITVVGLSFVETSLQHLPFFPLDEVWPAGANLARLCSRPMFAGLLRVFEAGTRALPHQDHFDWDASKHEIYEGAYYTSQLAANVYLEVPPRGGELVIWPESLRRVDYENVRHGQYGIDAAQLRSQPIVLVPKIGELIIFNSRMVHAVHESVGRRVTWSCFIGYRSGREPLAVWS